MELFGRYVMSWQIAEIAATKVLINIVLADTLMRYL